MNPAHAESFSNGQINLNIDISHSLLKPRPKPANNKLVISTEEEDENAQKLQ